jgi:chromosome segregation ATPase
MIDPLRIPSSVVDALSTLADTAKSLPDLASHLDTRAGRLEEDIAAMRQATERLTEINGVVASIDTRLEKVEARVEAIEGSVNPLDAGLDAVREGLSAVDGRMREMSKLQLQTNEGIDTLVKGVGPLESAIDEASEHAARNNDRMERCSSRWRASARSYPPCGDRSSRSGKRPNGSASSVIGFQEDLDRRSPRRAGSANSEAPRRVA